MTVGTMCWNGEQPGQTTTKADLGRDVRDEGDKAVAGGRVLALLRLSGQLTGRGMNDVHIAVKKNGQGPMTFSFSVRSCSSMCASASTFRPQPSHAVRCASKRECG